MANNDSKTPKNSSALRSFARKAEMDFETEVLFQRLGGKWYAFSIVEDECLMAEVTEDEVQKRLIKRYSQKAA